MRLTQCKKNINMKIVSVNTEKILYERLIELGFRKDANIKFLYKFGSSFAFKIKNTIIGLRQKDAKKIIVEQVLQEPSVITRGDLKKCQK